LFIRTIDSQDELATNGVYMEGVHRGVLCLFIFSDQPINHIEIYR